MAKKNVSLEKTPYQQCKVDAVFLNCEQACAVHVTNPFISYTCGSLSLLEGRGQVVLIFSK